MTPGGPPASPDLAAVPFEDLAAHVDDLRARVGRADPGTRDLLEAALAAITEFNRRGLATLVHLLREDPAGVEVLYRAVDEAEVMALLVGHGIVRSDRTLDVLRVVEQIRPHLVAASVELTVESVLDDVAHVRFPTGCSAPTQEVKDEIMGVIRHRVPGLREVREVAPEPAGAAFVPLASLRIGPGVSGHATS